MNWPTKILKQNSIYLKNSINMRNSGDIEIGHTVLQRALFLVDAYASLYSAKRIGMNTCPKILYIDFVGPEELHVIISCHETDYNELYLHARGLTSGSGWTYA